MANKFGTLDFAVAFSPLTAFPLDARYYFDSYESAKLAAQRAVPVGSSDGVYFYGENLVVTTETDATLYLIQPNKTLKEVGKVALGDNLSIQIIDDVVQLNGFNDHYYAYVADENEANGYKYVLTEGFKAGLEPKVRSTDNGKYELAWYEPNPTTIEGLSSQITTINENITQINNSIAQVYKKSEVYTKTETEELVNEKVAAGVAAADHLKRKIVNSVDEIDVSASDANQYIYLVPKTAENNDSYDEYLVINGVVEKVGNWGVNLENYYTKDIIDEYLKRKVSVEEGKGLSSNDYTNEDKTKVAESEKNFINTVSNEFTVVTDDTHDRQLQIQTIEIGKIANLQDTLDKKVDKTNFEALKIVVDTKVNTDDYEAKIGELEASINNKVDNNVYTAKIGELETALAGKVSTEEFTPVKNKVDLIEGKITIITGNIGTLTDSLDDLSKTVEANTTKITEIDARLTWGRLEEVTV